MSQLEKEIVAKVKKWCEVNDVLYIKFTPFGSKGWPDTIVVFPGGFHLWVELKAKGKKPRPLQLHRMSQLAIMGALPVWFDNADQCISYMKDCLDSARETMESLKNEEPVKKKPGIILPFKDKLYWGDPHCPSCKENPHPYADCKQCIEYRDKT